MHESLALPRHLPSLLTLGFLAVVACGGRTGRAGSGSGAAVGSGVAVSGVTSGGSGAVSGVTSGSTGTARGATSGSASGAGTGGGSDNGLASCPGPTKYVDVDGSTGLVNAGKCICAENAYSLDGGACTCQVGTPNLCTYDSGQTPQCVDKSVDPNNCGACGDTCKTSAVCVGGVCGKEPTQLVPPAPGCVSMRVVYDSGSIYWSDMGHGTISSIPASGGPATTIASNQQIAAVQDVGSQGALVWPSGLLATALLVRAGTVFWVAASTSVQCDAMGKCSGGVGTTLMSATAGSAPKTLLTMAMDPEPSPVSATDAAFSVETLGQNPPINAIALSPDGNTLYFAVGTRFYSIPSSGAGAVTYVGFTNGNGPEFGEATALVADNTYLYYPLNQGDGDVEILNHTQMCDLDAAANLACPVRVCYCHYPVLDTIEVKGDALYFGKVSGVSVASISGVLANEANGDDFPGPTYATSVTGFAVGTQNAYFGETGTELVCSQDYSTPCMQSPDPPFSHFCPEPVPANQSCVTLGYIEKGAAPPFDGGTFPSAVVIARAQPTPTSFALDGANVYWTTSRCDISYIADSPQ